MVAGDVGEVGFSGLQAKGVEELGATEGFADDLGFDGGVVFVDDLVGAQQQVALTVGESGGLLGAFVQAAECALPALDGQVGAGFTNRCEQKTPCQPKRPPAGRGC